MGTPSVIPYNIISLITTFKKNTKYKTEVDNSNGVPIAPFYNPSVKKNTLHYID